MNICFMDDDKVSSSCGLDDGVGAGVGDEEETVGINGTAIIAWCCC